MTDMDKQPLEWAIIAPATARQLEEVADEFRPSREGWDAR